MNKAKLIKIDGQYKLFRIIGKDGTMLSINEKLSIKNCQAIERGYDLDELAESEFPLLDESWCRTGAVHEENLQLLGHRNSFQKGFKKALEILGDKKFSEDEIKRAILKARIRDKDKPPHPLYSVQSIVQSFQQTEWDVEIVMDRDCYSSAGRCDKLTMADCIICTPVTYLKDADGCLILKRI